MISQASLLVLEFAGEGCPAQCCPMGNDASMRAPRPSSRTISPWMEFSSRVVAATAMSVAAAAAAAVALVTTEALLHFAW